MNVNCVLVCGDVDSGNVAWIFSSDAHTNMPMTFRCIWKQKNTRTIKSFHKTMCVYTRVNSLPIFLCCFNIENLLAVQNFQLNPE